MLSYLAFAVGGLGFCAASLAEPLLACIVLAFPLWGASFAWGLAEGSRQGTLQVEGDRVRIHRGSKVHLVPRSDIVSAQSIMRGSQFAVEIVLRNTDVFRFITGTLAEADAAVQALGFGRSGARQTFELAAPNRRFLHLGIGYLAYQVGSFFWAMTMALVGFGGGDVLSVIGRVLTLSSLLVSYFLARRYFAAPVIEVGDDGVVVAQRMKRVFHPRAEIVGADVPSGRAVVTLVKASGPQMIHGIGLDEGHARGAVHAMTQRWLAAAPDLRLHAFARNGRTVEEWRNDIRTRIAGQQGYRADGLTVEDAEAVLASAGADPEARIGAALALAAAGRRTRIADVIAPIADARVRVALETIASGSEETGVIEEVAAARRARIT